MKTSLQPGLKHRFSFAVPKNMTVPHLYPEAELLRAMPEVFATGFMVGLMEWTCIQLLEPHLDPGEGSLGVHIDVSHKAATPARSHRHGRGRMHRGEGTTRTLQAHRP
jgi:fluoroacetyl-CoA thioesterase